MSGYKYPSEMGAKSSLSTHDDPYAGARTEAPKPTVPRVASSLDDLRVGQVVAVDFKPWHIGRVVAVNKTVVRIDGDEAILMADTVDRGLVVILSDPPPDPVTVSRETFDRMAELVYAGEDAFMEPVVFAARALVDEVRGADHA